MNENQNELILISKQDLYDLLDSGYETGIGTITVDEEPYMKLHKFFNDTYGIHCGFITEDE